MDCDNSAAWAARISVSVTVRFTNSIGRRSVISNPDDTEKYLIFRALVHMIDSNSGIGFHNADQGHPAYLVAAATDSTEQLGDSAEQNALFKLLASFAPEFYSEGPDLSTWRGFCAFAVAAYNREHPGPERID